MKSLKRALSLILALAMIMSFCCLEVFAVENDVPAADTETEENSANTEDTAENDAADADYPATTSLNTDDGAARVADPDRNGLDYSELEALAATVQDDTTMYYTSGDRFNGNPDDTISNIVNGSLWDKFKRNERYIAFLVLYEDDPSWYVQDDIDYYGNGKCKIYNS